MGIGEEVPDVRLCVRVECDAGVCSNGLSSALSCNPASVASTAMAASSINVNVVSPALKPGHHGRKEGHGPAGSRDGRRYAEVCAGWYEGNLGDTLVRRC